MEAVKFQEKGGDCSVGNMDRTREEAGRIVKKLLWWLRKWYLGSRKNSGSRSYSGLAMDSNKKKKK